MIIRKATPNDATRINELLFQVADLHAKGRPDIFKSATKKYSDQELIEIINSPNSPIFVADEGGNVLGYAFCIFRKTENNILLQDKQTLYIDDICVDKNARGKGVGTSLYKFVAGFAKSNGFNNITLNVWAFNESAYKFYQACGLKPQRIIMEQEL